MFKFIFNKRYFLPIFLLSGFLSLFILEGSNKNKDNKNKEGDKKNKSNKNKDGDKKNKSNKNKDGKKKSGSSGGSGGGGAQVQGNSQGQQPQSLAQGQPQNAIQVSAQNVLQLFNGAIVQLNQILQNQQVNAIPQIVQIINQMLNVLQQQIPALQQNMGMLTTVQIQQLILILQQINGFISQIYNINQQMQQFFIPFAQIMMQVNLLLNPGTIQQLSSVATQQQESQTVQTKIANIKIRIKRRKEKIRDDEKQLKDLEKQLKLENKDTKNAQKETKKQIKEHFKNAESPDAVIKIINKNQQPRIFIIPFDTRKKQKDADSSKEKIKTVEQLMKNPLIVDTLNQVNMQAIILKMNNDKEILEAQNIGLNGEYGKLQLYTAEAVPMTKNTRGSVKTLTGQIVSTSVQEIVNSMKAAAAA